MLYAIAVLLAIMQVAAYENGSEDCNADANALVQRQLKGRIQTGNACTEIFEDTCGLATTPDSWDGLKTAFSVCCKDRGESPETCKEIVEHIEGEADVTKDAACQEVAALLEKEENEENEGESLLQELDGAVASKSRRRRRRKSAEATTTTTTYDCSGTSGFSNYKVGFYSSSHGTRCWQDDVDLPGGWNCNSAKRYIFVDSADHPGYCALYKQNANGERACCQDSNYNFCVLGTCNSNTYNLFKLKKSTNTQFKINAYKESGSACGYLYIYENSDEVKCSGSSGRATKFFKSGNENCPATKDELGLSCWE